VVAIQKNAVSATIRERIEPVGAAYYNKDRWNIDTYAG
jgi:hypothetical protein